MRESRYTKEFIDRLGTFTVSVPPMREMLDAVKFCGTKSGREYDKWAECALEKSKQKALTATSWAAVKDTSNARS